MRVLILGSTGGTGRELVRQALELGHEVTAFVRDPSKLPIEHERLHIFKGNVLDPQALAEAVRGQNAVVSALGTTNLGKSSEISEGTANVIRAMEAEGVKRLVFETTVGLGDSHDHLPWLARVVFFPLVLKNVLADKEVQEKLVRESSLEWVLVRPARLTNGAARHKYRVDKEINEEARSKTISRADVAEFMLQQLANDTYLRRTPGVSY